MVNKKTIFLDACEEDYTEIECFVTDDKTIMIQTSIAGDEFSARRIELDKETAMAFWGDLAVKICSL